MYYPTEYDLPSRGLSSKRILFFPSHLIYFVVVASVLSMIVVVIVVVAVAVGFAG